MTKIHGIWSAIALVGLGAFATGSVAEETPPPSFEARLAQATQLLNVGPSGLSGPGATTLTEAVAASRYVLIGESHLTREIPAFTTQVCRLMAPTGLTAMVIETGPEAAQVVDAAMRTSDPEAEMSAFVRRHPDGIAFFHGRDEIRMTADCAAAAGPDFSLWGLDQEFLGSSGHLLAEMLAANPGPVSQAALSDLAAKEREATAAAMASGSPFDLLLLSAPQETLDRAAAAVATDGGERVQHLFGLLLETRAIYKASQARQGDPNGRRARLMKRTLAAHLAAEPDARILMKFGAWHLYKSLNPLDQRDIGAYVAERAEGEGVGSLHIIVLGARGTEAGYNGVGRPAASRAFDMMDADGADWRKDVTAVRAADAPAGAWMLVDLRKLRQEGLKTASEEWRQLALGYDVAILAPTLTATTVVGAPDAPTP